MPPLRSMCYWAMRLVVCAACVTSLSAIAAEPLAADECPTSRGAPISVPPTPPSPRPVAPGPILLRGDNARSVANDVIELRGDAEVARDGEQISADYLRYDRNENYVFATGEVTVTQPGGTRFTTGEVQLDLDSRAGSASAGTYRLTGARQGRGDTAAIEFLDRDRTRLSDVRYTTCPPNRDDWFLRAKRLDLDTAEDIGVARNVTLNLFGLPILYLPYLSFPISDQRKSGFLFPQVGYGNRLGTVVAAPYYLNLAPDYDATLTPRVMTDRGLQLQGEFRYLGQRASGQLNAEYLADDKMTHEDRAAASFIHQQTFNPYWSALVNLRRVSDKDYVSDFGDRLSVTSETHLPQNAELNYRGSVWAFTARASDYQTIDRTIAPIDQPYARLPQLLLAGGSSTPGGAQYLFEGELVNFERDAGVTGQRVNLSPSARLPLTRIYGFLIPEVGVRHIGYSLDPASPVTPSVTAPFAALDTGLYFDREVRIAGHWLDHTLEPRLYYAYVPYRPQDDLPNFDTSIPDFSFANLFRINRFVGGDRIGDTNRLTMALTTRLLDPDSGVERFNASIGRIHYFDERRVNLPAGTVDDTDSDIAAEAVAWLPGNWHARANTQWAPDGDQTVRSSFYLQHQPAFDKILNIGYRYARNELKQIDVSAEWPLTDRWLLRGRSLYSLRDVDHGNIDGFVGAEYRSCCWAVRLYALRTLVQAAVGTEQRSQFFLELELAGLSGTGSRFESPLRQGLFTFPASPAP